MNWKLIIIGALVFWVATLAATVVTYTVIHEMILGSLYQEYSSFWRPELSEESSDMAALMPHWLATSLFSSLVVAALYSFVHPCLRGPGWRKGMIWGLCLALYGLATLLGLSGVINLPLRIWVWWGIEGFILFSLGGAAMGWAGHRWAASS